MRVTLISAVTIFNYKTSKKVQIMLAVFFFWEIDQYYAHNDELCQKNICIIYQNQEVTSLLLWWRDFFHVNPRY